MSNITMRFLLLVLATLPLSACIGEDPGQAEYNLGENYHLGRNARQDYILARQWYEKAAAKGNAKAQFSLGMLYESGHGVPQDRATAKEWYGRGCDNGLQFSCDQYRRLNTDL